MNGQDKARENVRQERTDPRGEPEVFTVIQTISVICGEYYFYV